MPAIDTKTKLPADSVRGWLSTRDGWAELYDLEVDKPEQINLKEQMPELYEKLREEHREWQIFKDKKLLYFSFIKYQKQTVISANPLFARDNHIASPQ